MNYIELSNTVLNQLSAEETNLCNAYIKFVNNKIEEQLEKSGFREKLAEAIAKGLPYYIDEDLNIMTSTEEEFYKTPTQEGKEER
jgi:citrate lyase alpha subunit